MVLAGHTASLRRSLSCLAAQGVCSYCPPFLEDDAVYGHPDLSGIDAGGRWTWMNDSGT